MTKNSGLAPSRRHRSVVDGKRAKLEQISELFRELMEEGQPAGTFEEYEETSLEIANEIVRRELERKLQSIADGQAPRLLIDHNNDWHGWREGTAFEYAQHEIGTVTYHSLVGGLTVRRYTYRECLRGGAMYVPLELAAGLMERMTPRLAYAAAHGFADMPMRRFEQLLLAAGRRPPSRSTLERSARDLGSYAMAAKAEIMPVVRMAEKVPEEAVRITLGLDRTSVPMRPSHFDVSALYIGRDLHRSRPREIYYSVKGQTEWRMDYVGTVCFVDKEGERLTSRKYRLPSDAKPAPIIEEIFSDLRQAIKERPDLKISVVQDGAPEMWSLIVAALGKEPGVKKWDEVLDWYHLDERLGKCLELSPPTYRREAMRAQWHTQLLNRKDGIRCVLADLKRLAKTIDHEDREQLFGHIRYIQKQKKRTCYADLRRRGVPIGSGVTEGACKSLVGMRAKRSGQRWAQRGLTAALHLRAIHQSDRFDEFWPVFSLRYRAASMTRVCHRA